MLSADEGLQTVSNTARGVLRGFGAYVGEDWRFPEALARSLESQTDESPGGSG